MPEFSTPMMKQYQQIKDQHQDCLLFFRLGDFYELFNEDAKLGSQVLNITLTKRPRGKDGEIPMAGVPFHAADAYIAKLVRAGHKVAICEQVSEPDARGIVEREVIRIVTPGTILDEKTLDKREHNYTMSLAIDGNRVGFAVADLSTGDFQTTEIHYQPQINAGFTSSSKKNLYQVKNQTETSYIAQPLHVILGNEIARFSPAECIVSQKTFQDAQIVKTLSLQKDMNIFPYADWENLAEDAEVLLKKHFRLKSLHSFNLMDKPQAQRSSASLLGYLKHTQKDQVSHLKTLRTYAPEDYLILDRSTIANLELFSTLRDQQNRGSLIDVLDHTATAMGARMLRTWLRKPLTQREKIQARLDAVQVLCEHQLLKDNLRELLRQIYDLPRLLSRLSVGIGNAYDLVNLKASLKQALKVKNILQNSLLSAKNKNDAPVQDSLFNPTAGLTEKKQPNPDIFQHIINNIPFVLQTLIDLIENTINDNPPIDTKNGGLIKTGINAELDDLRAQVGGGKNWIAKLEATEKKRTGINSLKIKFNQVFGYFIEISKANLQHVPDNYLRKQTMVNAERFITPELKEYEEKVLRGQDLINDLELKLFLQVVRQVLEHTQQLQQTADALAGLDCLANFAEIAVRHQYVKPQLTDSGELQIKEGRHPVVERLPGARFVPNDTMLNLQEHQLLVLTGPNMAGKSVYMRQVALITLMAHLGCFVPAQSAIISLTDRIFCRSGASDVIASGLSTFMVEMVETAHILIHATNKSLVIMDEIGRGTSTYDGISIAWAVAEFLVTNPKMQAKTLFATHYHELQMLEDLYTDRIRNFNVAVQEKSDGEPIFLHKVIPGRASHSYAIAVAKLAGVPETVTNQAQKILQQLEKNHLNNHPADLTPAVPTPAPGIKSPSQSALASDKLLSEIADIDLPNLTPIQALNLLADWQKRVKG